MKFAKIYSPFSHLKSGFLFKGEDDIVKKNTVLIKLTDDYKKIHCSFSHDENDEWKILKLLYRDLNTWLSNEQQSDGKRKWYGSNPPLIWAAEIYGNDKKEIKINDLMKVLYVDKKFW